MTTSQGLGVMTTEQLTLEQLYERCLPSVAAFVGSRKGSMEDAMDIYHDALIIFLEKQNEGLVPHTSAEKYVLGIAKHLWIRKYRADARSVTLEEHELAIAIPNDNRFDVEKLMAFVAASGQKCMELLRSFYYDKITPSRIATVFGFRSTHSAAVQKYKCLEKIRNEVKEKSLRYEDFIE